MTDHEFALRVKALGDKSDIFKYCSIYHITHTFISSSLNNRFSHISLLPQSHNVLLPPPNKA